METYTFRSSGKYCVFVDQDDTSPLTCWSESDEGKIETPYPGDICATLDSVKAEFESCFGRDRVNAGQISILPTQGTPQCFFRQGIIFLSAKGVRWAQFAYQFAHELCHAMIAADVAPRLRWFEETLCELASLFFLRRMSETWKAHPPYHNWSDYATALASYYNKMASQSAQMENGESFKQWFAKNIASLEKNHEQREKNRLCALQMLPVFEKTPQIWRDVPLIGRLPEGRPFGESLNGWWRQAEHKEEISEIIALFLASGYPVRI